MKISDMSDEHIRNRIKYLERMRNRELEAMDALVDIADPDGDMAHSMTVSREFYRAEIEETFSNAIKELAAEQYRRINAVMEA